MGARGSFHGGPNLRSDPVACNLCGAACESRAHAGQHRRRVHGPTPAAPLVAAAIGASVDTGRPAASASTALSAGAASVAIHAGESSTTPVNVDDRRGPLLARFMARVNPAVEPVSAAIVSLPWIRFSRRLEDCATIVERVDELLAGADGATESERAFWDSLRAHVVAIAVQAAATAPAR